MTTVQKFEEALTTPEGALDALNASENVIVMVDEAHRTQYGMLGARMSRALPNATLIGFTGTPIDKGFQRSTMGRFGPLIDSYTIPQSVADGATVPIYYEARLPELAVEGPETLDRLYEAMFGDEQPAVQAQLRRRYANKETVAEAERRIEMIALDIAGHFKAKVRPNGFKAQVVAPSRAAALRYAERLNSFGLRAYPVITAAPNDGPEFKAARELDQEQVVSAFVDPEGEPEALVVVDMLLTGFDAPVEQALYLDRALREHGLLQAIARVNRRFSHQHDGWKRKRPMAWSWTTTASRGPGGGALDVRVAGRPGHDARDGRGPGSGRRRGRRPGGVPLQGPRLERHVGMRQRLRAGRLDRGQLQGGPVRAVQRGLPAALPPHGPLPARPASIGLHGPARASHGDTGLRPGAVPSRGRRRGLDRDRRQGEEAGGRAHQRPGARAHEAGLHTRPGLRSEGRRAPPR